MRSARSSWFESTVAWVRQRAELMRPEEVADAVTFFALAR